MYTRTMLEQLALEVPTVQDKLEHNIGNKMLSSLYYTLNTRHQIAIARGDWMRQYIDTPLLSKNRQVAFYILLTNGKCVKTRLNSDSFEAFLECTCI